MAFVVTFLGTSSGGGPSATRNCSSLVCDLNLPDRELWMVDCAEGTLRQIASQPSTFEQRIQLSKVKKVFITHLHADHIMGLVTLLRNVLWPPGVMGQAVQHPSKLAIELYGPAGLRLFIRQNLKMTFSRMNDKYVVHELLNATDTITPCEAPSADAPPASTIFQPNVMHPNEVAGQDYMASPEDGLWRSISLVALLDSSSIVVNAGPIHHRDPCIGYVFSEVEPLGRKLVILGDTHDPSPILPLCSNPSPSLLIHEATDSPISPHADPTGRLSRRVQTDTERVALARGHSLPHMAGAFAKQINAQRLVLNHIGSRFPAPRHPRDTFASKPLSDMEHHANRAWGPGKKAIAAEDFTQIIIPPETTDLEEEHDDDGPDGTQDDVQQQGHTRHFRSFRGRAGGGGPRRRGFGERGRGGAGNSNRGRGGTSNGTQKRRRVDG